MIWFRVTTKIWIYTIDFPYKVAQDTIEALSNKDVLSISEVKIEYHKFVIEFISIKSHILNSKCVTNKVIILNIEVFQIFINKSNILKVSQSIEFLASSLKDSLHLANCCSCFRVLAS